MTDRDTNERTDLQGEGENRRARGQRIIVPVAIAFVLGLFVGVLIFRTVYAPSSDTNEGIVAAEEQAVPAEREEEQEEETPAEEEAAEAEEQAVLAEREEEQEEETPAEEEDAEAGETVAADAIVEIPDPALKEALQSRLEIGNREITEEDALSLFNFEYYNLDNQIKNITGLSAFKNLRSIELDKNLLSDISALSGLTNLEMLYLSGNPVLENKSREEIMEVLSGAENLTLVDF